MPPTVPAFPATAIEAVVRELAETVTGSQIPSVIAPLKIDESGGAAGTTKWKRLFNAVVVAQNRQRDGRPLIRLIAEAMSPVRFNSVETHTQARHAVNERLILYGYEVRSDGKVATAMRAATLDEAQRRADDLGSALRDRAIHDRVLEFCRPELLQQNYFHAVLEAAKSVADRIRDMSGLEKDGSGLVDAATSTKHGVPLIAFNGLVTEWERSEHVGLAMLAKGLFSAVRNPTAHAPKVNWAVDRQDALDVLTLASLLHRRLDAARIRRGGAR